MTTDRLLMVSGALLVISALTLTWLFVAYLPGATPLDLFLDGSVILKLVQMVAVLAGLLALIGGATGSRALALLGSALAVGLGLIGLAYSEMVIQQAMAAVGSVSFAVTAPSHAEGLQGLVLGLVISTTALGLLKLRGR
jgi:hypothetical protein